MPSQSLSQGGIDRTRFERMENSVDPGHVGRGIDLVKRNAVPCGGFQPVLGPDVSGVIAVSLCLYRCAIGAVCDSSRLPHKKWACREPWQELVFPGQGHSGKIRGVPVTGILRGSEGVQRGWVGIVEALFRGRGITGVGIVSVDSEVFRQALADVPVLVRLVPVREAMAPNAFAIAIAITVHVAGFLIPRGADVRSKSTNPIYGRFPGILLECGPVQDVSRTTGHHGSRGKPRSEMPGFRPGIGAVAFESLQFPQKGPEVLHQEVDIVP
eukprot:CAMPEP_0201270700 /NCGR_PEP_ID=MMETSP0853-20130426/36407_1 /ASSEMBLY_ACC=CAM_ASM_000640 /TAXON_ID=183588 /ORGANISM="Pseudo-nitzschia fraudulenta, Strain WWA7" /LENGTH=268 /DNA_ID=CAMNT_0047577075 /DNA_START=352 /DNA_END=1154 /DNA_ORIENTATION=+